MGAVKVSVCEEGPRGRGVTILLAGVVAAMGKKNEKEPEPHAEKRSILPS